jgi:DNA polymerase-3 subunit epsilon
MTGGQGALTLDEGTAAAESRSTTRRAKRPAGTLLVVRATASELQSHENRLAALDKASGGKTVWRTLGGDA